MKAKVVSASFGCLICLIVLFAPITYASSTQLPIGSDVIWHTTFGGTLADYGNDIIERQTGGYVIVGGTLSSGITHTDLLLVGCDWNGNELWNQTIGGPNDDVGYAIIECTGGGFAMTGYSRSNPSGRSDAWLVRTTADGTHLWNRSFGGLDNDQGFDIIEVAAGGFALVGSTRSYGSEDPITHLQTYDIWLIRTDAMGNILWNRTYGQTGDDIGRTLVELSDGGFLLLGEINSSFATLDHSGQYTEYHPDAWLIRTNQMGEQIWNQTYGGESNDFIRSAVINEDGGFTIVGFTNSYSTSTYDGWLLFTASDSTEENRITYGSHADDYFRTLLECESDGYALIGYTYLSSSADLWLTRTNVHGVPLWARVFGGLEDDVIRGGIRSQGNFILVGYTFSFGAGSRDVWLVKIADEVPLVNPFLTAFPIILVVSGIVLIAVFLISSYILYRWRTNRIS
ncbi:MAG: hypothetical protein ACFFBR_09420 [Promethearchaeota archaeon]